MDRFQHAYRTHCGNEHRQPVPARRTHGSRLDPAVDYFLFSREGRENGALILLIVGCGFGIWFAERAA
jgi:hypothetical protein